MNKEITNHPSALDINEIWAAIEPQVDIINAQRKKRKPAFIYWLSGLALLVGLGIAGLFLFGDRLQTSEVSNETLPDPASQVLAPIEVTKSKPLVKEGKIAPVAPEQNAAPIATTNQTSSSSLKDNNHFKNTIVADRNPMEILVSSESYPPLNAELNIVTSVPDNINTSSPNPTTKPLQKKIESVNTIPLDEEKITPLFPLAVDLCTPSTKSPELNFSIKNNKSQVPPPIYIERPTFSIEFQTGISAVNRTLNATGDRGNSLDTLVSLRNTFEEPLEALHANLLVNAHFPSGFFVSSGIGFTQINELYSNNSTVVDSIIDPMGIQKLIINITGDTIPVIGPVTSTRTTTFTKKYYNSYRMIDIPIFVGYQYDFGDWKTDFSLGVFANILLATEGRIPNTPTTDLDLSTDGDNVYRSRVDYSLQFGIGVSKSLTDKLSLRVNPMFRYYSRNFINEDVGLNQRYLLFGGTVGLRMDL